MLPFSVELKPGLPVAEQILFAVKKAVISGQLQAGEKFPSVRQLSQELKVNPNTAHKVVAALVQEGVLSSEMADLMKDFDMYVSGNGDVGLTNQTGHPAVIVPYMMSDGEHSQPVCTTIIGNLFEDDRILSVAHAYQQATDWHLRRPKL